MAAHFLCSILGSNKHAGMHAAEAGMPSFPPRSVTESTEHPCHEYVLITSTLEIQGLVQSPNLSSAAAFDSVWHCL